MNDNSLRVRTIVLSALACVLASQALAQSYPDKPIQWIVPSSPGGGADTVTRLVANALPQILGQRVVVDNRAGASGNIGATAVARAVPDGYTWLMIGNAHAANISLFSKLQYDLVKDFAPVTQINASPHVILVHSGLPANTLAELVALAKASPGKLDYASAGSGTVTFLAAEMFKDAAGIDLTHVPYKGGGESLRSIVAGETSVYFSPLTVAIPLIQQGRVRALAVTGTERVPMLPDVPSAAEAGFPGYSFALWNGLVVPAQTPKEVIAKIHASVAKAAATPESREKMASMGYAVVASQPEAFANFIKSEVEKLGALVNRLKLKVE
jgi:tripartite-type tricarboxylate transporter receptor subunit TctC